MKKRMLAVTMATAMVATTACSGGSKPAETTAAPAAAETTAAASAETTAAETEAEITEPVTIKFANYGVLEAGYDVYWNNLLDEFKKDVLSEELLSDVYPNMLNACSIDGEAYGVPMYVSPFLLYYNKDLFEKAGLDPNTPPTTYEEMLEIAPKLAELKTDDGNQVYPFGLTTASVPVSGACLTSSVYNFGGTVLDENGNLAIDDGFRDAVNMWKELHDKGYNPENSKLKDLRNLFALGQLAMYYDQSWGFNGVKSINPDAADFIASAAPLKGGNGEGASVLQAGTLMVMDNGDARKAATAKLVDYIMSEEKISQYFEDVTPAYPSRQSMEDLAVVKDSAILAGAAGSVSNVKPVTFIPTLSDLNLELCTLAQAVTVSGTDVDTAIANFEKAAKAVIEQ